MMKRSDSLYQPEKIGNIVIFPIPRVDKAKSDFPNVLGVVMGKKVGLHKIKTKMKTLNNMHTR